MDAGTLLAVRARRRAGIRAGVQAAAVAAMAALAAVSAAVTKQSRLGAPLTALAAVDERSNRDVESLPILPGEVLSEPEAALVSVPAGAVEEDKGEIEDGMFPPETRWFDGRPVRPARQVWMTVTAYSPDAQSCGAWANGTTSSLHSVWTNGMKLVAADTSVLPLGSMVSVPGYDEDRVVPVLDRGGAIKGRRLDVLYPTHEQAQKWGVQRIQVTIWDYADGKPAGNWRDTRDSKPAREPAPG